MYLKVSVQRSSYTDLYIKVDDNFKIMDIFHNQYDERLGKIAVETTDSGDWDDYEWEQSIEVNGVSVVTEEEANHFQIGILE